MTFQLLRATECHHRQIVFTLRRARGPSCFYFDDGRVRSVIHLCERVDLFIRIVIIGKNFETFSKSWEKSGVRGIASQFSNVVLTSVPQRQAKEIDKSFF